MGKSHTSHRGKPKHTALGGAAQGPARRIVPYSIEEDGPPVGWMRTDPQLREINRQGRLLLRAAHRAQE